MLEIGYCADCLDHLMQFGNIIASTYTGVCEHYVVYGKAVVCIQPNRQQEATLRLLEEKGYIKTTESGKRNILIQPLGHTIETSHLHVFCIHPEHKND